MNVLDSCIICGDGNGELKCPADRTNEEALEHYEHFIRNLEGFRELDKLPVDVKLVGCESAAECIENRVKWHKACHLKFANSKLERTRQRLKRRQNTNHESEERKSKRPRETCSTFDERCIFCLDSEGVLHNCSTLALDKSLREMAAKLQDTTMLSRIGGGDLIAIEAKYHNRCLTAYRNRYRAMDRKRQATPRDTRDEEIAESQVFAELVSYVENGLEEGIYIFRLSELHLLYEERLGSLGYAKAINKSRLKTRLLAHFLEECQEQFDGRNTLLVFNEGMRNLLKEALESRDFEQEALSVASVSKIVRRDMFDGDCFHFSGTFPPDCEEYSVPSSLRSLVSMLLYGANIKDLDMTNSRACLTICQLILFNSKDKARLSNKNRHIKDREPPLPLYLGLDIHTLTRNKKILTQLYDLGISVSYERVLEVEDCITTAVCQRYREEDLVCPSHVREGVFTVGALDNIDHNPSSTTAQGSFHGTSISILQFPTVSNPGICREPIIVPPVVDTIKPSLPDSYRIVPAVACNIDNVTVARAVMHETIGTIEQAKEEEVDWLQQSISLLAKEKLDKDDYLAWGAYHASRQPNEAVQAGISCLLPLFEEKAASVAMIRHGMTIIKEITAKCNPMQIPVIAVDQPLFALAKYVQWSWPAIFGEDVYIVMLGGLHIEIALWRMIGDLLEDSGWTTALSEAGVASSGTADSFITASHVTKTRHAHQITVVSLAKLQQDACQAVHGPHDDDTFESWKKDMVQRSPTFKYWDIILRLEMLILIFVRSHRERNFSLYVEVMELLAPWFFILDHINYARWLPVHIRDMKALCASTKEEFQRCWTFPKTTKIFSAMPLDQAHEQNNKIVKDSGGAVGLTENPVALKRWMVSGPEQARLLAEFERLSERHQHDSKSHEQGIATQQTFQIQVNKLCDTISSMGNPFMEESHELMTLDTHDCVDEVVVKAMHTMEEIGKEKYAKHVKDVLVDRTETIHKPIKKNKMPLFKRPHPKTKSKTRQQTDDIKSDYSLFSQMFIACQVRQADLSEFFGHENHPWPPSLSHHGKLRLPGSKSELLDCLKVPDHDDVPQFEVKIFDGAAVVHALPRTDALTFGDYCALVFLPWTKRQLENCKRIDVVWDTYKPGSLKDVTREKRGKGARRKVSRQTKLPVNFPSFLRDSKNKEELFALLTEEVAACDYQPGKEVYITSGQAVVSKGTCEPMKAADHEEADTRLCLHVQDAVKKGATNIMVSTVDTDVVVILAGTFTELTTLNPALQLWVAFGKGKHFRYYHINSICQELGVSQSLALPFFHAFTGSDTTSQFGGKGKKSSWKTWKAYPAATEGFLFPVQHPFVPIDAQSDAFAVIERFTCILYDGTTTLENVNDLRQDLFCQGKRVKMMQNLPPTQDALLQHTNRSMYQASIWITSLNSQQNSPKPNTFGWTETNDIWRPIWMTIPEATKSCRELIKCRCKAEPMCTRKCICKTSQLECTSLCHCSGNCER